MINFIKKQTIGSWLVLAGAVLGLVSVILFLVNATTGYFLGQPLNAWIPVCSFLAIALAVCSVIFAGKFKRFADIGVIISVLLLCIAVALFILARIDIFSKAWFILLDVRELEAAAAGGALTGVIFYVISILTLTAASFFSKLVKNPA